MSFRDRASTAFGQAAAVGSLPSDRGHRQHGEQDGVSRPDRHDPGDRANVSPARRRLRPEQRRGVVVKGKGEMTTYLLLAERTEPSVAQKRYEPASSR
jgi:hypothetical protein